MINKESIFFLVLACVILYSCGDQNKKRIKGIWAVEELDYNSHSYMNYLNTNIIVFEEDGYVSLPETYHFAKDYNSEWFIIEDSKSKSNKLVINSSNLAFKDTFKIKFVNDITKGKGLILTSDSLFIKAYKFSIE